VFLLLGISLGVIKTARMPFQVSVFPRDQRVSYVTAPGLAMGPPALLITSAAGLVMDGTGPTVVFLSATVICLLSLIPLVLCHPRQQPPA